MLLTRIGFVAALLFCAGQLSAMPPAPELIHRLERGELPIPYYLDHEDAIRETGVNSPTRIPGLDGLLRRSLDTDFNAIAILVDFSDHVSATQAVSFNTLLFGDQTGSVKHYFGEITYGSLTLVTINLPGSLGWYRMPQTYGYYVDGQNGFGTYPRNAQRLAEDAILAANPAVNFANYDNDGDGFVDALFIVHSGTGAEWSGNSNDIWSHKWGTRQPVSVDGVFAFTYAMEPEFWNSPGDMTCGVFAHEMGHATFGLPDLYDTDGNSRGLGRWSLMAGGSWNGTRGNSPAHPDAWCRVRMGVAQSLNVTTDSYGVTIPQIETSPFVYRVWTNGSGGSQYFLVENRQRTGYDAALPAAGLLIYHIDETQSTNRNQWYPARMDSGNYRVALEQADGLWELERNIDSGDNGDPFPGAVTNRTFDYNSTPNSRSYAGSATSVAIRNISNSAAIMTADLLVGNPPASLDAPSVTLRANGNDVIVDWQNTFAPWYRLYSSETPQGPFTTLEGSTSGLTLTVTNGLAAGQKFYAVVASMAP